MKNQVINTRKRAKKFFTCDFRFLYTVIPHNLLIEVLSEIMHFVFKSKVCSKIEFSATSIYWTYKGLGKRYFTEKNLSRLLRSLSNILVLLSEIRCSNKILESLWVLTLLLCAQICFSMLFFFSLSMSKILLLKNQLEHINTMLLVNSQMTFVQQTMMTSSQNPLIACIQEN